MTARDLGHLVRWRYSSYPPLAGAGGAALAGARGEATIHAAVVVLALWWGGMVTNHVLDVARDGAALAHAGSRDGVAREARPLVTGAVSRPAAIGLALLFYATALALAAAAGPASAALAGAIIVGSFAYNARLKTEGLSADVGFAALVASCFVLGGLVGGRLIPLHATAFLTALFYHTGVHIYGCVKDYNTDRLVGCRTLPVRVGIRRAALVAGACNVLGTACALVAWRAGSGSPAVLVAALVSTAISVRACGRLLREPSAHGGWLALNDHIWGATVLYASFLAL